MIEKTSLPAAYVSAVVEVYEARLGAIQEANARRVAAISKCHLSDFDWSVRVRAPSPSFGCPSQVSRSAWPLLSLLGSAGVFLVEQLVVASGKLATQRSPIVVLTLSLKDTDGTKRDVLLELSQSQLDDLLRDFANVNHVLGTISV